MKHITLQTLVLVVLFSSGTPTNGQHYNDTNDIFNTIFHKSRYNTDVIPILNQSEPLHVYVSFELLSLVEVNDITQSFMCNGILNLFWKDERAQWNPDDYGGQNKIHPKPSEMWRPRVVLFNTLDKRDLFADDHGPTRIEWNGEAFWFPGSVFPAACKLELRKYPFDVQHCYIKMLPMALMDSELVFDAGHTDVSSHTINGAWHLVTHGIETGVIQVKQTRVSYFQVNFKIQRRPTFFLLNILLPVVLLSFLNILVFAIPVESGEKIGYGITVLLALTVFLSIVSSLLPQSSDVIPSVTIYLFLLLAASVLTVIDTIIIVFLSHLEEKNGEMMKARQSKIFPSQNGNSLRQSNEASPKPASSPSHFTHTSSSANGNSPNLNDGHDFQRDIGVLSNDVMREYPENGAINNGVEQFKYYVEPKQEESNKYKTIGRKINFVSFLVFIIIWVAVTVWIFCEMGIQ